MPEAYDTIPRAELIAAMDMIGNRLTAVEAAKIEAKKAARETEERSNQRLRELTAQVEVLKQRIEELEKRPVGQVVEEKKEEPPAPPAPDPEPSEQSVKAVMKVFKRSWER